MVWWSNSRLLWCLFPLIGIVCILSSCSMRKSKEPINLKLKKGKLVSACSNEHDQSFELSQAELINDCSDDLFYDALACEAKLSDVPVPLGSCPLRCYFGEKNVDSGEAVMLGYMSQQDKNTLITFYEREMFACGWRLMACVNGSDNVMIFEKPDRICAIILGSYDVQESMANYNKLVIAVGPRLSESMVD